MNKEINKCDWCREETNMPQSFVAMSPIMPIREKKMKEAIETYGEEWWIGLEKDNPKLMDKLSFYDQLVSKVGRAFVCAKCLDKDAINYNKFRKNEKINTQK